MLATKEPLAAGLLTSPLGPVHDHYAHEAATTRQKRTVPA